MKPHDNETIKPCCQKEKEDGLVLSKDPVCGMSVTEDDNSLSTMNLRELSTTSAVHIA